MTLLPSTACNVAIKASRHGIHDYQSIRDLIPLMKKVNLLLGEWKDKRCTVFMEAFFDFSGIHTISLQQLRGRQLTTCCNQCKVE